MFKRNEGTIDRILRVALGLVLVTAGFILLGMLQGNAPDLVFIGLGGLALITGITGFSPLYVPLGINTFEKERELIDRCKSMMAGFRQRPLVSEELNAGQMFGGCPPSSGEAHQHS